MRVEPAGLKILFLASEAAPLIKVGGLGDVAGSLPLALRALSAPDWSEPEIDVRLVLPFHEAIRKKIEDPPLVASFYVDHPDGRQWAKVYLAHIKEMPVYLIDGAAINPDGLVYSRDPEDDGKKYVFFSLAAIAMIRHLDWKPDVIHANDWHTGAALYSLKLQQKSDPFFKSIRSLISVHNLPFMGKDAVRAMIDFDLPPARAAHLPKWAEYFPLPLGLSSADHIVAVSPGYAAEILTPEFGCGLQDYLATRTKSLTGILNGLDQQAWDPSTDMDIVSQYSAATLDQKPLNKSALLAELEIAVDNDIPLLIMVTRMDQQKGVDIAVNGLRLAADLKWQAVILGTGDSLLESSCRSLEAEFPDRVRALITYDGALSRRLYAAGDILLMPSRYEPCGLSQMIAMRYGTVPLARSTGGLRDTIHDDPTLAESTGFLFDEADPEAFADTLRRTLYIFSNQIEWRNIQMRGMNQDFSWSKSALEYGNLYLHHSGR